jgi:hypothetical protein
MTEMTSKWFISMEDAIKATHPLPKYEAIWESFISDAEPRWKTNLLKSDETLYDWDVVQSKMLLKEAQDGVAAAEKLMDTIRAQITLAEGKKLKRGEKDPLPGLKEGLGTAVIDRDYHAGRIILLKREVTRNMALQQIAIDQNKTLRNILGMYLDGGLDNEWMKKAVTWCAEEAAKRMKAV